VRRSILTVSASVLALAAVPAWAGISADSASLTGPVDASFPDASAAVGPISGDTTYGGLNPFNPPFDPSQIVRLDAGDTLTLHLSSAVPANGRTLGVFSSVGFADVSSDGSGQATGTIGSGVAPATFDEDANGNNIYFQAVVSVSQDGTNWFNLGGGSPVAFTNPTNAYTDTTISGYYQPLGSAAANTSKPFLGSIGSFSGQDYAQIKTTLDGSAGGTWLNTANLGITSFNYVKISVPAGAGYQAVIDAVAGTPTAAPIVPGQPIVSESVGAGVNTSSVVVDFGPQSFDFLVHYDGSISGIDALNLIEADSYFTYAETTYSFGDFVTAFDYGGYDEAGAGNTYWHYFTSADGVNWSLSGAGASARMLTNGSYDGWNYAANSAAPATPVATVPEPAGALAVAVGGLIGLRRRRFRA
jgi:hypothetical protein